VRGGEALTDFSLNPPMVNLPFLGEVPIPVTLLNAMVASLILIVLAAIVRIFLLKKFTDEPKGVQNVIEIMVDGIQRYTESKVGSWAASTLAPYIFTLAPFIMVSGLLDLVGLRPNMSDINSTVTYAFA
jgi:F-type H+-transporting ATPase subunit a